MTETPIYEVRCPRCQTSFAPETRRCVHCGGPVGRGGVMGRMPQAAERDEEVENLQGMGSVRSPLWILTAILVVVASAVRTCMAEG